MSRKRTRRTIRPLVNPILHAMVGAAITDSRDLDTLRLRELSAIECFAKGQATRDDWMALADLLNIMETLCRDRVGHEAMEPCMRAQEALGSAHDRRERTGRLGVTGPELNALREAFAWHDAQRTAISRARYEQAITKTTARIRSADPAVKVYV